MLCKNYLYFDIQIIFLFMNTNELIRTCSLAGGVCQATSQLLYSYLFWSGVALHELSVSVLNCRTLRCRVETRTEHASTQAYCAHTHHIRTNAYFSHIEQGTRVQQRQLLISRGECEIERANLCKHSKPLHFHIVFFPAAFLSGE
jgi:hypothetical protein